MTDKVKVTFLTEVDERTNIRKLSAEADCSQGEFLLSLVDRYGSQEAARMRQAKHGAPAAIAGESETEASKESPVVSVFINEEGELTENEYNGSGLEHWLASVHHLKDNPEWVEAAISMNTHMKVREGVLRRYSPHDGRVVWADL